MPGPPPKHPSIRARRNRTGSAGAFRVLSSNSDRKVPPFPLADEVGQAALLEVSKKKMTALRADVKVCKDGRARGRLQRQLNHLDIATAKLDAEIKLAASAEHSLWAELWAMPQAAMWEEAHSHREVAQYVRWKVRAEAGNLDAGKEARMLSDRLGLNPLALLRLRAEVERVEEAERRAAAKKAPAKKTAAKKKPDPRSFLSVVGEPPNGGTIGTDSRS